MVNRRAPLAAKGSKRTRRSSPERDVQTALVELDPCESPHSFELAPAGPAPKGRKWRPVCLDQSINLTGGYHKDRMFVETREVCSEDERGVERSELFCKLDKNAEWLLKAVGGHGMRKGGLSRCKVLANLRVSACGASSPPKPRGADPDDLMLALDACDEEAGGNKHTAIHYKLKRARERVLSVVMPERAVGRSGGHTREVRLLASSTTTLWIAASDVPWLVCFVADEVARGGVPVQETDTSNPKPQPNTSVPGLFMAWDFQRAIAIAQSSLKAFSKGLS